MMDTGATEARSSGPAQAVDPGVATATRSLRGRISSGLSWTLVGSAALKVFAAITSISLARILGAERFGEYGIVQSTVLAFATYGALRMGNTAVKYVAQYREQDPARAARILKLAMVIPGVTLGLVSLAVMVLAPVLADRVLHRPELCLGLVLGGIYLFFLTYTSIAQQALAGFEDFKGGTLSQVLRAVLACALCIPLGWLWGVEGALVGLIIGAIAALPPTMVLIRRNCRHSGFPNSVSLREALREANVLWSFALPGFLALAVTTGAQWGARLILARQSGFGEVGRFEASGQWTAVVFFLPMIMARVFLPILSSAGQYGHGTDEFRKTMGIQLEAVLLSTGPLTLLMLGTGHWLVHIYGQGYENIGPVMAILFIAGLLRAVNETFRVAYESRGRQWMSLWVNAVWAAVLLLSSQWLTNGFGGYGLALAILASEVVLFGISGAQVHWVLVPGILRPHLRSISVTFFLAGLGFAGQEFLKPLMAFAVCLALSVGLGLPVLMRLRASGVLGDMYQRLSVLRAMFQLRS